jgi:hypothetical protein
MWQKNIDRYLASWDFRLTHGTTIDKSMRTKTLLLTAALGAACVSSAIAQVYSVNAVGYVNTVAKQGFNLISNPLDAGAGNNTVAKLLAGLPNNSAVYTYAGGLYNINTKAFGNWQQPNNELVPGQGFFLRLPAGPDLTITFVGEVKQGTLTTPLAQGFNLVASQVPQAGGVSTLLGLPIANGEAVFTFDATTQLYTSKNYAFGGWQGGEPSLKVGEGFWVRKNAAGDWTRTFSVNP